MKNSAKWQYDYLVNLSSQSIGRFHFYWLSPGIKPADTLQIAPWVLSGDIRRRSPHDEGWGNGTSMVVMEQIWVLFIIMQLRKPIIMSWSKINETNISVNYRAVLRSAKVLTELGGLDEPGNLIGGRFDIRRFPKPKSWWYLVLLTFWVFTSGKSWFIRCHIFIEGKKPHPSLQCIIIHLMTSHQIM